MTLIYWATRATGPIILFFSVGITIRRVPSAFLTALLRFLELLFELFHLFGQMAYLIGIPASWFLPGLLHGIEGLGQPVLLAAVLIEPTTLRGVVGRERSVDSLAPLAILVGTTLLGGPLIGPSPMCSLSLPGYSLVSLRGCRYLGLIGSGCFVRLLGE